MATDKEALDRVAEAFKQLQLEVPDDPVKYGAFVSTIIGSQRATIVSLQRRNNHLQIALSIAGAKKISNRLPKWTRKKTLDEFANDLNATVRLWNCLSNMQYRWPTLYDLLTTPQREILRVRNYGRSSHNELLAALGSKGIFWPVEGFRREA